MKILLANPANAGILLLLLYAFQKGDAGGVARGQAA
jgi:hypothetical protein